MAGKICTILTEETLVLEGVPSCAVQVNKREIRQTNNEEEAGWIAIQLASIRVWKGDHTGGDDTVNDLRRSLTF